MFAQYACGAGIIRLLTLPPPERDNLRAESTFLTLEEPILKGKAGECRALRIIYTHPMVPGAEGFAYELWPNDCTSDWLQHYETEGKEINEAKVAENAKKATIATNTAEATIAVRPMEAKGGKAASSALIKVKKKKKKTKKAKKAKKATASAEATGVKKTRRGKEEQKAKRAKKVPEAKKEKKAK
ncbi:Hypothetical predicted protein [Lecanosticta acicola]|uniref:Uncharacterized protein n=1 Tax=Lecanosticta acicola TaxID=111012 RepID=A0AAI8Z584_9PEZI|nr:Hypothetical predicted protein [Lecanosticta acicola]